MSAQGTAGGLVLVALVVACGVAPVRRSGPAAPPTRHTFAGPHGRPLAYGGGVCAIGSPHTHSYPPVPAAMFERCPEGAQDRRALFAFIDPHPTAEPISCHITGWHLHTEAPAEGVRFDEARAAYRADGAGPPDRIVAFRTAAPPPPASRCAALGRRAPPPDGPR